MFTAGSFLVALVTAALMKTPAGQPKSTHPEGRSTAARGSMLAGVRTIWGQPVLRAATLLLLLSNSRAPGLAFLEHATDAIRAAPGDSTRVLLVPFAGSAPGTYAELMRKALAGLGVQVASLHETDDPTRAASRPRAPSRDRP